MRFTTIRGPLGLALFVLAFAASATDDPKWTTTGYKDRIKTAQTVQPLGETPFGESVDLYKGGLSFNHTDISYPGVGPTITISRSYTVGADQKRPAGFGDWSLNIPRIETIIPGDLIGTGEWKSGTGYARCSGFSVAVEPYSPAPKMHWWNGFKMITPDGASQSLLRRDAAKNTNAPPSTMGTFNIVTASNWMIDCTAISNPGSAGFQGEGFRALAPDGTKYYFDHLAYGPSVTTLIDESHQPSIKVARKMGYLYLSKIVDRFGNTIKYTYNGDMLVAIDGDGTDDRRVAITWTSGKISKITIQPASSNAQVWTYTYDTYGPLSSVELPDHSKWQFSMGAANSLDTSSDPQGCGIPATTPMSDPALITITHPSGLVGTFSVGWHVFGRSKVPSVCGGATNGSPEFDSIPAYYWTVALDSKSISGPGLDAQDWTYTYNIVPSTDPTCATAFTGCVAAEVVDVHAPDGYTTRYTHSAEWGNYEGKLLSVIYGIANGNPAGLRTETHEYAATTPFPLHFGNDPGLDYSVNQGPVEYIVPESKVTTTQQQVTFVRTIGQFDPFANPLSITRTSSGGAGGTFTKAETIQYAPTNSIWWPGRESLRQVKVGSQQVEVSKTDYDPVSGLPSASYSFGLKQQSFTYDATGMLTSVTDALTNKTTLSQWYRGIPRLISFPTGFDIAAGVNDVGRIESTTDELKYVTGYGYDSMGRLASIVYPTGDAPAWNPLGRTMALVTVNDGSGIVGNHWTQTVTTGNGRNTTYYDARWLPVLQLSEEIGNASSRSYVVRCYDGMGRQTFQSYPLASATVNCTLPGVRTSYDGLGRPVQLVQDSELGPLVTATEYLPAFQVRVTNPNGNATTTSFQVFDTPSTDSPVRIDAPQGVRTDIVRDLFGSPLSITRSGPGN